MLTVCVFKSWYIQVNGQEYTKYMVMVYSSKYGIMKKIYLVTSCSAKTKS